MSNYFDLPERPADPYAADALAAAECRIEAIMGSPSPLVFLTGEVPPPVVTDESGQLRRMCVVDEDPEALICEKFHDHAGPHAAGFPGTSRKLYWYTGEFSRARSYPF